MNVLITGNKGFIGSSIESLLKKNGFSVIGLDKIEGFDITDWESIKNINNFDVVIHLAAISFVPLSYEIPREMYKVNILGVLNMLELCRLNKAKMIFTSSYVYGNPQYLPIDENHPLSSHNPYCQSKLIGEKLCESYNKDFSVPVTIFRPFNIYGKGQNENFLIPQIQKQIEQNKKVQLKDPRPKRDFIHVDDVARAYYKAVECKMSDFEIFNLGSGTSVSVREITDLLVNTSSAKVPIEFSGEKRDNEVLDTVADISKAEKILGWKPFLSIKDGITNLYN